ncbi:MAG: DUF488 domain-containing protein [Euryarchaeota archaeon]|nr:DUF488 domain-containing protein [Euryarchaeota archaeon]
MNSEVTTWTIGHSNRSLEDFLSLLEENSIKILVDIRRFPTSRWPHFKKENLEASLKKIRIKYVYLGQELGGYRTGGYEKYMKTKEFKKGVEKLLLLAKEKRACIMCAEQYYKICHRNYLSKFLHRKGVGIIHILGHNRLQQLL